LNIKVIKNLGTEIPPPLPKKEKKEILINKGETYIKTETASHYVFQEINTDKHRTDEDKYGSGKRGGDWLGYVHVAAVRAPVQLP
jgi:hypothetical protein